MLISASKVVHALISMTILMKVIIKIFMQPLRSCLPSATCRLPVVPDAPIVQTEDCSTKDDDGDGVNNCNDRCPNSQAGQAIGPDGCPVPLTIDSKGVNFDFDKDTLRPDALVILDEAADILNKYPQLKVEVAGHTDSVGTEVYNQDLSQRRAQVVFNYLTGKGVDAGRLVGPKWFSAKPNQSTSTPRKKVAHVTVAPS